MFSRNKILLDEPAKKRNKPQQEEDEFLQHSDEEVLGYSTGSSDAEDDSDDASSGVAASDQNEVDDAGVSEDEMAAWGASKSAFYNTDKITNEEEALAEEQEARRLQQKRLKSLRAADFGFDESEWVTGGKDEADDEQGSEQEEDTKSDVVRETLPQLHVSVEASDAEKLKILRRRYPEFEGFAKKLVELQPVWDELEKDYENYQLAKERVDTNALAKTPASIIQFRALSAFLGALTMYFAVLTSPARESVDGSISLPLSPHELREHDVIGYIRQCESNWENVVNLDGVESSASEHSNTADTLDDEVSIDSPASLENSEGASVDEYAQKTKGRDRKPTAGQDTTGALVAASQARRDARKGKILASLEQANAQLAKPVKPSRNQANAPPDGDYGLADGEILDDREAAAKAQRKKSLRFYTSRIAQKANKEARFAEGAAGDEDIPYKERFRDKVERLNREAEARGRKGRGDDMRDGERAGELSDQDITNADREAIAGDEDYKQIMGQVQGKKEKKRRREEAYQEAKEAGGRVERVAQQEIGPDGRREITYAIAKNKGLTPKRRKEIKNPRVKKRQRYEQKTKKLQSMKPTWKGGEGRGGYGGELTGIKPGLVKSVKL